MGTNENFSTAAAAVKQGGKAKGYSKQTDLFDLESALAEFAETYEMERYASWATS